jgi:hypothetical protein
MSTSAQVSKTLFSCSQCSTVPFAHLAPGLADLVELAARSSVLDMSVDEGASFCADDESQGGLGSLPSSAVKPKRAARTPLSSMKAVPKAVLSTPSRAASGRASRARLSYAEKDSDSDDVVEEEDADEGEDLSDSQSGSSSEGDEADEEEANPRSQVMSPTKHFVGKARGRSGKASVPQVQKVPARGRRIADENSVPN